jgi:hypothetical protein
MRGFAVSGTQPATFFLQEISFNQRHDILLSTSDSDILLQRQRHFFQPATATFFLFFLQEISS